MMQNKSFKALVARRFDQQVVCQLETLTLGDLPVQGDLLIAVRYSSLNYKDALALTNSGDIIRQYPLVPGIDLVGKVVESSSAEFQIGDQVIAHGYGLGERYWGGFAQYQWINSAWAVKLPAELNEQQAMAVGTAGFTAMLAITRLQQHGIYPDSGKILVTGAVGGVGSFAVFALAQSGYQVTAQLKPGRGRQIHEFVRWLGAEAIVDDASWQQRPKPLESQRWCGAVDTVGGVILARLLSQLSQGGAVTAMGVAAGSVLSITVMPFILRGVTLYGISAVETERAQREQVWQQVIPLMAQLDLDRYRQVIPLQQLLCAAEAMMQGGRQGRTIVDMQAI